MCFSAALTMNWLLPDPLVRHAHRTLFKLDGVFFALGGQGTASCMLLIAFAIRLASAALTFQQLRGAGARHAQLRSQRLGSALDDRRDDRHLVMPGLPYIRHLLCAGRRRRKKEVVEELRGVNQASRRLHVVSRLRGP